VFFVKLGVKVKDKYYTGVLLTKEMLLVSVVY